MEASWSPENDKCILLSPSQLRDIWDFDNECGSKIMGAPLRTCSCREDNTTGDTRGLSASELTNFKILIKDMWKKANDIFEIYIDSKEPASGYRMRVKQSMAIKITVRSADAFYFGWCAVRPERGSCCHLYERSPVKPCGYMGGPASFINFAGGKQATVIMSRPLSRMVQYLARLECRNLAAGVELTWNNGWEHETHDSGIWFKQCCSVLKSESIIIRHQRKRRFVPFMNVEKCVLCGEPFSTNNKERKIQRKPHLINSHADFLGSTWNGIGSYMQQEVDGFAVLKEADKLNSLLMSLTKELKWNVMPACKVLSVCEKESYGNDNESLLSDFKTRCKILADSGTLVLRGMEAAASMANLSIEHIKPIPSTVWKILKWKEGSQPASGVYSVPIQYREEQLDTVQAAVLNFCQMNLRINNEMTYVTYSNHK